MRNFILGWFVVSVAIIALVALAGVVWTGPYFLLATWSYYGSDLVEYGSQSAVSAYETGGVPALDSFVRRALPDGRMQGYLFDAGFHEVRGHDVPEAVGKLARKLQPGDPVHFEPERWGLLAGTVVSGRAGGPYRIVISFVSRRGRLTAPNPLGWLARIGAVFAAAALLCMWLAWRLSAPLGRLREATRKFASGDLAVRAGAESFPAKPPEYAHLAHDFDDMAQRIETLVNSQRQLLRDISHELRAPLTRLGLAVNIARRAGAQPPAESLDRIDQESERLNTLIGRIIRLSRMESLEGTPRREPIELADFLDSIVSDANFEAEALRRRVTLHSETCRLLGDRELLREALENVIRNAIRYTPEGATVEVNAFRAGPALYKVVVRDAGPGVPPEHLAAIFRPFHRAPQPGDETGFGLGLTIARRAVELHQGAIAARNLATGGFEVEIDLPV